MLPLCFPEINADLRGKGVTKRCWKFMNLEETVEVNMSDSTSIGTDVPLSSSFPTFS